MKLNKLSFLILSAMGMTYASAGYAVTPEPIPAFDFSDESKRIDDIKNSGSYSNADADAVSKSGFILGDQKFISDIHIGFSADQFILPITELYNDSYLLGTHLGRINMRLGVDPNSAPTDHSVAYNVVMEGLSSSKFSSLQINEGTKAYNTTVGKFSTMEVRTASRDGQRAEAYNTRVNEGGRLTVSYNSYAENNLIDGGELTIPGSFPKNTAIVKNNIIRNGGTQIIYQGTAINNYITGQGSYQMASGLAENNYIYDGGYQMVYAGGDDDVAARNTTIYQGGTQRIKSGIAEDNLVYGTQIITSHQGDWKNGQWVSSEDPTETQGDTPTALNSTIMDSGEQIVSRMGNTENTLIDGGKQYVEEYAGIRDTTIRNGGSTVIDNGGYSFGKLNVEKGSVTLKSGGKHYWTEDFSTGAYAQNIELMGSESLLYITPDDNTSESVATISSLKNNGVTIFGDISGNNHKRYSQLNIKELTGNGLFVMNTSLADGSGDFLSVSDNTNGKFGVRVMDSGKALVSNTSDPDRYHLIHAAGSQNDTFTMTNKSVDLGAYKYYLVQDKDSADEWYLSPTKETAPVDPDPKPEPKPDTDQEEELPDLSEPSKTAMMIANALPQIWRSELSTLRARLGELRNNPQVNLGVWSKVTGGRHNISNNEVAYRHDISGIVAGGDKMTELENGYLWSGVVAGYSHSSLKMDKNDGTINSYSLGVYTTWQHKSGIYVDGVVKANHFRSDYDAQFNDGKTSANSNTSGIGFSVETGKYFEKDNYFIEPYAMVAAFRGQGADYRYSNEMSIKADAARSFSGELGATFGKNFVLENGTQIKPYIRVAVNHEFLKNGDVELNKQGKRTNDMSGTTGKYGIGVDAKLNDNWAIYGEFNYANGSKQETPYSGFLGVNYRF
ncbi:autotransporter outer membrane beta-barrel domain-containing protein [Morganella morganii]|uniref:autotransporter outer membrane beta-barrel domain-containing protein n=1 Tax=Morganella morganii TaxID=582 RepID=UPI001897DB99|nr:autotransporter outer membrane beta-barrel domain-containing protein [Morganella morganii]